jgi:acetyl esterase/lipase
MTTPESQRIRATFVNNQETVAAPLESQRQEWEAAVEATNLQLSALITSTDLDRIYGEWVAVGDSDAAGVLLFMHGGGYNSGSCKTHRALATHLARAAHTRVLLIDYRLAPEHPCPAAIDDAVYAYRWLLQQGIAPQQIGLGGDSAGGGLAAVVCQTAAASHGPRLALQVLFCPVLDMRAETRSRRALAEGYFLNQATMDWMLRHYCPPGVDPHDPRLSPLRALQFTDLPPAHIHTAEFDPLRDEGEAYAQRLQQAGVAARYTCHAGMIHHFYAMAGAIPPARIALKAAAVAMREALVSEEGAT